MCRYMVIDKSLSCHCCFGYTVVDTTKPYTIGGDHYKDSDGTLHYESVCECFDEHHAKTIANSLNKSTANK